MTKRLLAAVVLLMGAAPLFANTQAEALIAKLWSGEPPKLRAIVDKAEEDLLVWLQELAAKGSPVETHFDEGAPCLIEGANAKAKTLTVRMRERTWDDAGRVIYKPLDKTEQRRLADWPSRYALVSFTAEKNENDQAVAAFALWLYERKTSDKKAQWCGNRALTVLHDRNEGLRELVEACVLAYDFKGKDGELAVCSIWDREFRAKRKALLTPEAEKALVEEREKEAKAEWERVSKDYRNIRTRQWTLVELITAGINFGADYGGTKHFAKVKGDYEKLRTDLDKDHEAVKKYFEEGTTLGTEAAKLVSDGQQQKGLPVWKKAALKHYEALKLDPASYALLTHVANAWLKAGNPVYHEQRWTATHLDCIKEALPCWYRLAQLKPRDTRVLMDLGMCYQLTGKESEADKIYNEVVRLEPNGPNSGEASRRMLDMRDPGGKREERDARRKAKADKEAKEAKEAEKGKEGDE